MRVLHLFLSLILLTTTCFGQYLKPIRGMQFVNRTHRLARGLKALWLFNEGSGDKVFDLSGNGNTGIFGVDAASPIWVPGKSGSAISFDGSDYVSISNAIKAFPFSIVCWFNVANVTDNHALVFNGFSEHTTSFCSLYARGDSDGDPIRAFTHSYSVPGVSANAESTSGFTANTWHQAVGVWVSPSEVYAYIDGGSPGMDNLGELGAIPFSENNLIAFGMNRDNSPGQPTTGLIDNVSIYNRALSAGEIAELYAKPFGMFQKDNTALIVSAEAPPPPTGGQVIMITSAIPVILILAICLTIGRIEHDPTQSE